MAGPHGYTRNTVVIPRAIELAFRATGSVTARGGSSGYLTILLYHRVLAAPDPLMPAEFDARVFDGHMAMLARVFNVLPLEEALVRLAAGTLPSRAVCITFDDGYRDNFEVAYPILQRYGLPATFFIATGFMGDGRMFNDTVAESIRCMPSAVTDFSWFGLGSREVGGPESRATLIEDLVYALKYLPYEDRLEACNRLTFMAPNPLPADLMMTPEQVRMLSKRGMTIGGHTHDHPILSKVNPEIAWSQITRNREVLAALLDEPPRLFAYPNGKPHADYGPEHVQMVKRAGYSAAVSVAFGAAMRECDPFEVPRIAPWDRDPTRYAARMLTYVLRNRFRFKPVKAPVVLR